MSANPEDERRRLSEEAKFLSRHGDGIIPQRFWNAATDLWLVATTATTDVVDAGRAYLAKLRGRL
jgi:hypothetical protein